MNRLQRALDAGRADRHPRADRAGRRHAGQHRPHAELRRPAQPQRQAARQDAQVRGDRAAPGRGRRGRDHRGNVGEAGVFAAAGFDDIFLAYPIWAAGTKGARIRRLAESARLRVGVDNVAAIEALADAMGDEPDRLQVVIEVDCGARRSGAPPRPRVTSRSPPASAVWCRSVSSPIQVTAAPVGTLAGAPRRTRRPRSPPRYAASPVSGSPRRWSAPAPLPPSSSPPAA